MTYVNRFEKKDAFIKKCFIQEFYPVIISIGPKFTKIHSNFIFFLIFTTVLF